MAERSELGEPTIEFGIPQTDGKERTPSRARMVRDIAVFQGKLALDGLRDGMLVPVSIAAGVLGLVSRNQRATRVFYDVLRFGQRTERWINLFQPVCGEEVQDALDHLEDVRARLSARGALDAELTERLDAIEKTLRDIRGADFFRYRR